MLGKYEIAEVEMMTLTFERGRRSVRPNFVLVKPIKGEGAPALHLIEFICRRGVQRSILHFMQGVPFVKCSSPSHLIPKSKGYPIIWTEYLDFRSLPLNFIPSAGLLQTQGMT